MMSWFFFSPFFQRLLKTNINAKKKQINDCLKQTSMLRTSKLIIAKKIINAENKQINYY